MKKKKIESQKRMRVSVVRRSESPGVARSHVVIIFLFYG